MRYTAALVAAASVMAACSGSEGASDSTVAPVTEPPITTEVVEEPETTTSTLTTTTTSSTTTTSTTTTSTTLPEAVVDTVPLTDDTDSPTETTIEPVDPAPTNTLFDPTSREGEVEQAAISNLTAFRNCLSELPNCDSARALRFGASAYAAGNGALAEEWNEQGVTAIDAETWVFVVESVEFTPDGTEAVALICSYDGSTLLTPATETTDEIVDTLDESNKTKYQLIRIDERWAVQLKETIETVPGKPDGYCR